MDRPTAAAIGAFMAGLRDSLVQIRRPSFQSPPFWSRPLVLTRFRPVAPSLLWTDLAVLNGSKDYISIVNGWVATSLGSIVVSGLEFRFTYNGTPITWPGFSIPAGFDLNKAPGEYPVIPRQFFQQVAEKDRLAIQVRNTSAFARFGVAAFYGWTAAARDATYPTADGGVTDNYYESVLGLVNG